MKRRRRLLCNWIINKIFVFQLKEHTHIAQGGDRALIWPLEVETNAWIGAENGAGEHYAWPALICNNYHNHKFDDTIFDKTVKMAQESEIKEDTQDLEITETKNEPVECESSKESEDEKTDEVEEPTKATKFR